MMENVVKVFVNYNTLGWNYVEVIVESHLSALFSNKGYGNDFQKHHPFDTHGCFTTVSSMGMNLGRSVRIP